ncbi:TPR domain protein [Medicago truncatula]|uniref:TPR domain protein n=1 Tax=Medicago truncatula TaxID=3880 RepID=A0A072V4C2_MEDTR|nr:TPR domain protein [Medicago truncatula]
MDHSLSVSCHAATTPSPKRSWIPSCTTKAQQQPLKEIRVCTNRACRKQGAFQTLETLSGIAPPNVSVKSSGCLGKCGAGPNLVVLPDYLIIRYCGTAARCLETMVSLFGGGDNSLDALALRKMADVELEKKNFAEAELLLSQAIDLKPFGGIHVTFKCRSSVRLELGNYLGALQDANEALILAPEYSEVTQILIFFYTQLASINILLYLLKTTSNSFILILKTLPILAWSLEILEFELRPLHI